MLLLFITGCFLTVTWHKPLWGLLIILALPVFGEFSRISFLEKSIVLSDLLIPLFTITSIWKLKNQKPESNPEFAKLIKTILLFLTIAFLSLIYNMISLSMAETIRGSLYFIRLIFYLSLIPCSYFIINKENIHILKIFLIIIAIAIAAGGFLQLQILPDLKELAETAGYDPHINRLVGSWLDPNFIGGYFATISLLFISLGLYTNSSRTKILLFTAVIILLPALFLTYSRSAWLAFLGGLFVLGLIKSRHLLIAILIVGGIGLSISDRAQQRAEELVTSITSVVFNTYLNPDPTARLRIQNWEQTMNLIKQKPILGHGYNNLITVKMNEGYVKSDSTHSASGSDSSLLTLTATTGFAGLLIFIYFLWQIIRTTWSTWHNKEKILLKHSKQGFTKESEISGWSLGLFIATITLLIHSNFVNSLLFPQIMIFYFILTGAFYSTKKLSKNKRN